MASVSDGKCAVTRRSLEQGGGRDVDKTAGLFIMSFVVIFDGCLARDEFVLGEPFIILKSVITMGLLTIIVVNYNGLG